MALAVVRHPDVRSFLERAEAFLLAREAENNLVLGIAEQLARGDHGYEEPVYLATVEDGGAVVGCAWRTPPHKAGLSRMPSGAAAAVADDMAGVYDDLPAVLAEASVAGAFARRWSELRGVDVREGMRMRIHELTELTPPPRPAPGVLRAATEADRELAVRWWEAFCVEARVPTAESGTSSVDRRMAAGDLFVWDDGGPVSMVGVSGRSPNGARIGPVYTPPERRGRGYGTSATAAVTRRELDGGRSVCFLYTDLTNPTSNAIYAAIGYRPVCDVVDLHFEER